MKAKKVLVTGAAGFVGSHLIDRLLQQECEVVALDVAPIETCHNLDKARGKIHYVQADIRDKQAIESVVDKNTDAIFHLASIVGVHKYMEDPFGLIDITIGGTRNIIEAALRYGTKVVYTSTSEVFGKNPAIPWTETADRVLGPTSVDRWSYSTSKATCEHLLYAVHRQKQLPMTIVRYFNAYGPRQNPIFVVSQSVHRVLNNQAPDLYDGGEQTRCFTYIDDAIEGTLAAAWSDHGNGESFNIGNDREITIKEIVELACKYGGFKGSPRNILTREKFGAVYEDIPRRVPSAQKALDLLGWKIQVQHEEGIRRTTEWARANQWWLS